MTTMAERLAREMTLVINEKLKRCRDFKDGKEKDRDGKVTEIYIHLCYKGILSILFKQKTVQKKSLYWSMLYNLRDNFNCIMMKKGSYFFILKMNAKFINLYARQLDHKKQVIWRCTIMNLQQNT